MAETVRIFYSWQSDLPDATNRQAIRAALRAACSKLEKEAGQGKLHLKPDEATRDEAGAINIPQAVIRKVKEADIFIADVSTVTLTDAKRLPNPNVVFELGFATGELGWERIVLLFNEAYGKFPDDLPFDFDRHRTGAYALPGLAADQSNAKAVKEGHESLRKLVESAIRQILENKPKRPREMEGETEAQTMRRRDLETLKWLLASIHQPSLQQFIADLPQRIRVAALDYWDDFCSVVTSALFHIYDDEARKLVGEVYQQWRRALEPDYNYVMSYHGETVVFQSKLGLLDDKQQKDWNKIEKARKALSEANRQFLTHVRKHYVEIDIDERSEVAWRRNREFHKKWDEKFSFENTPKEAPSNKSVRKLKHRGKEPA